MKKRIVICADGTWRHPEEDLSEDFATNVLKLSRAIEPLGKDKIPQQVFYDWGVGSYYDKIIGGATGKGVNKNIMDCYRYIVQNYSPGDELYLFGFSRGAYTVRSLAGLIYNCGILERRFGQKIQEAFDLYRNKDEACKPSGSMANIFRNTYSCGGLNNIDDRKIKFIGVWDTVGSLGIPLSVFNKFSKKYLFHDVEINRKVKVARHAMAIDERRGNFRPAIWHSKYVTDIKQVWFVGVHRDVGGSYKPDPNGTLLADIPLLWMVQEAVKNGLFVEQVLIDDITLNNQNSLNYKAEKHNSMIFPYILLSRHEREIDHGKCKVLIHQSVQERWNSDYNYRPDNLKKYINAHGWDNCIEPY